MLNVHRLALILAIVSSACGGRPAAPAPDSTPSGADAKATPTSSAADVFVSYLRTHNTASDPRDAAWSDALDALAQSGDEFSLVVLDSIDRAALSEEQRRTLEATTESIESRVASDEGVAVGLVVPRLERAAYADLMCDRLEDTLREWTLESVADGLDDPAVLSELRRIESAYEPSLEVETTFSSLRSRVPDYATRILANAGDQK